MSQIILQNQNPQDFTLLPNWFIDQYMPRANGEFVKIYIALLRRLAVSPVSLDAEQMADHLLCTEKDILRALRFWEKEGLVQLSFDSDKALNGIIFLPQSQVDHPSTLTTPSTESLPESQTFPVSSETSLSPETDSLSRDRMKELQSDEKISLLLYSAERYLGKALSQTEMQKFLYFYDVLHMSVDLIEFLIEYCVSRNHKSIHYMEKVALSWASNGIRTVAEAKESTSLYNKSYFQILKAMGINNRNPVGEEIGYMQTWMNDYGFDLPIILDACSRTVLQTGQASFPYADKILAGWKASKVRTLSDVKVLDEAFRKKQQTRSAKRDNDSKPARSQSSNRFNNFHQREFSAEEYEKLLLGQLAAPKDPPPQT